MRKLCYYFSIFVIILFAFVSHSNASQLELNQKLIDCHYQLGQTNKLFWMNYNLKNSLRLRYNFQEKRIGEYDYRLLNIKSLYYYKEKIINYREQVYLKNSFYDWELSALHSYKALYKIFKTKKCKNIKFYLKIKNPGYLFVDLLPYKPILLRERVLTHYGNRDSLFLIKKLFYGFTLEFLLP